MLDRIVQRLLGDAKDCQRNIVVHVQLAQ